MMPRAFGYSSYGEGCHMQNKVDANRNENPQNPDQYALTKPRHLPKSKRKALSK